MGGSKWRSAHCNLVQRVRTAAAEQEESLEREKKRLMACKTLRENQLVFLFFSFFFRKFIRNGDTVQRSIVLCCCCCFSSRSWQSGSQLGTIWFGIRTDTLCCLKTHTAVQIHVGIKAFRLLKSRKKMTLFSLLRLQSGLQFEVCLCFCQTNWFTFVFLSLFLAV